MCVAVYTQNAIEYAKRLLSIADLQLHLNAIAFAVEISIQIYSVRYNFIVTNRFRLGLTFIPDLFENWKYLSFFLILSVG